MDFGIMKRILFGTALLATTFLAACGYSDFFASDDYPASSTVEPASFSHIPHAEKVLFIDPEADHQLGERDLLRLLYGRTLVSRSVDETSAVQYSYFSRDGLLAIYPRPGRLVLGQWRIEDSKLCYDLSDDEFCSSLYRTVPHGGKN
ncbi:MAG: hypothetical protein VXX87_04750 [Pseudomonadota bacterium]|nr:hypothetical protein [Pseudomonadota bacterium]